MLDLKRLQYLRMVYQYKNFTRASEALYVSQPAISAAVSGLEEELGVKLIARTSRKVEFTPEGEQVVRQAVSILDYCGEMERTMKDCSASARQFIRLGISSSISSRIAPAIFSDFLSAHPTVSIQLEEGAMNEHISLLQNGELDLAYNALPDEGDEENLTGIPIDSARIFAVMHPDHPLARLDEVPVDLLGKESLVMTSAKSKVIGIMTREFEKREITPRIVLCYSQIACMVDVVWACKYVGLISVVGGRPTGGLGNLSLRPVKEPESFLVGFLMHRDRYLPKAGYDLISFVKGLT